MWPFAPPIAAENRRRCQVGARFRAAPGGKFRIGEGESGELNRDESDDELLMHTKEHR